MQLNLPPYDLKTRSLSESKREIFDPFRKKYVVLTPEEWVRQNFLRYLIDDKGYPESLVSVEKGLQVNRISKRFDAVVFTTDGKAKVLLEFKAPGVKIKQGVFEQIAAYNQALKVKFLIVSNGLNHYCCRMDYENNQFQFLAEIPAYKDL